MEMWPEGMSARAVTALPWADSDLLMSLPSSNASHPRICPAGCSSDPATTQWRPLLLRNEAAKEITCPKRCVALALVC